MSCIIRAEAVVHRYVEDFTTAQYKDTLNTTAWWDTVAGELKLYPFSLTLVGSYNTPGTALGVHVSGDLALVVDGTYGLQVIDISNPASPALLGTYDPPGLSAEGVHVAGDHAFVVHGNLGAYGLQVVDISNPASPTLLGSYNTLGDAQGVYAAGDYAFVADGASGLKVIGISNPASPALLGSYNTPGDAQGVHVSGDYAFVADGSSGLQVIDIGNPASPALLGSYNTPGTALDVYVSGDYAFVADGHPGLQVIDISNPASPVLLGSYDTPDAARGVYAAGDYAYVSAGGNSGLRVIDISNPASPTPLGSYSLPDARDVHVEGDHAFVAGYTNGLQVIDTSNPASPVLLGSYNTPGTALGVDVSGDYAFVADGSSGLQVIDTSNPASPVLLGSYNTSGSALGVDVSGDYAFVADGSSGLQVIDIGNPASPALLGSYSTPSSAEGVDVSGDYAFVADLTSGLQVIDISNPVSPALLGSYDTSGLAFGVDASGDYAFVADGDSGLHAIDISNPASPALLGSYDTPSIALDVYVSGDYAFVADGHPGLQVIDISNPASLALLGSYDTPDAARGVYAAGDYAYVTAGGNSGLWVIQVFQGEVDPYNDVGRSLAINASNDTIVKARLTATQTDSVVWELSVNGGMSWQGIEPDGSWNQPATRGADLMWRSTLTQAAPGVNPTVTHLEIDWLVEAALLDSIVDIPDDQGGWVRAFFTRSGRDFPDETSLPIDDYGIWQRVDNPALLTALSAMSISEPGKGASGEKPQLAGLPVITHQGKTYIQSSPGLAASSFPPGTWELVLSVPAIQQDNYVARVPTVADSSGTGTNYSVFVVTAHTTTPSIWYISEPDSGYSLDNIAPAVPEGFAVAYNTGSGNQLSWDPCPDEDFQYFCVYRSNDPDFVPAPTDLVHNTTAANWTDPVYDGWNVYYKITACDFVGNESDPASAGTMTAVTEPVIPRSYALYQNVPNPFNPMTTIRYDVPAGGGDVTLRVYDVAGRLVRTLVDGTEGPGEKTVTWNGSNDRGQIVASGVYFYRMTSESFTKTRKMLLMK